MFISISVLFLHKLIEGEFQVNWDTFPVIMAVKNKQIVLLQSTCSLENALLNKATCVMYKIIYAH